MLIVAFALTASLHCTANAETWSLFVLVSADGDLQVAGEDYARRMMTVAEDTQWSVALQLDNGLGSPVRELVINGQRAVRPRSGGRWEGPRDDRLAGFFRWARDNAPADRYAIVVYGHGASASGRGWDGAPIGEWPIIAIDGSAGGAPLRPSELAAAIRHGLGGPVDVIVLDSCYGASLEIAWDLRRSTEVIVASPGKVLSSGLPWGRMLGAASGAGSEHEVARRWANAADGFVAVQTGGLQQLASEMQELSAAVVVNIEEFAFALTRARNESAAWGYDRELLDVQGFCLSLAENCTGRAKAAATETVVALGACIISDGGAVTQPFMSHLTGAVPDQRPDGYNEMSGWGDMARAYRERQQKLMRRTFGEPQGGGDAT